MKFIGITGGVGAGKSEVLGYIQKHYRCEIYLADEVAHEVKKKGTNCYRQLLDLLGQEVVDTDGELHKGRMADKIFQDVTLLQRVNEIVHPAVKEYLLERLKMAGKNGSVELFFVEAALLIEAGYCQLVDEMWYIYAKEEVRRQRLRVSRGYTEEKIDGIIRNQLSEEQFRANCDFVLDNSGRLEETCRKIDEKLEAYTWLE